MTSTKSVFYKYGKGDKMSKWLDNFNKKFFSMFPQYRRYTPFYDDTADYNTNSKSYYDYLARINKALYGYMIDLMNRLLARDVQTENTESVKLSKDGDWIAKGDCLPDEDNDIITLKADVIISKANEVRHMINLSKNEFTINNGTKIKNDGVWSPDYYEMLSEIDKTIGEMQNEIGRNHTKIEELINDLINKNERINMLESGLQKIVNNLFASGAITNNRIKDFEFNNGRNIATGNINFFGGTADGNSFIRTNSGSTNNDVTAGY